MITTKEQQKRLNNGMPGSGWIVYKSSDNEITEIEIYVGRDNKVRRVGNGKPLLPISFCDEEEGIMEAN